MSTIEMRRPGFIAGERFVSAAEYRLIAEIAPVLPADVPEKPRVFGDGE
jgi:hypothetical protein